MSARSNRSVRAAVVQLYRWIFGIGYERNVGGAERAVRYGLGVLCLVAAAVVLLFPVARGAVVTTVVTAVLVVCGLYLLYEAQVQYCPLNHTTGRSTYRDRT